MTLHRPGWDDYFLDIAQAVARRADCRRAQHGAVVVTTDHRICGCGYNGSPPGGPSCFEGACPRGLKTTEELAHLAGDYSNCRAVHAEANALLYADHRDTVGATIYITGEPCSMCAKLIAAAGIARVIYPVGRKHT